MKIIVINMEGELYSLKYEHINKISIVNETKIGDTYFLKTKDGYFSCFERSWDEYKVWRRDHKINQIIQKK
jgi:hypothetical protein